MNGREGTSLVSGIVAVVAKAKYYHTIGSLVPTGYPYDMAAIPGTMCELGVSRVSLFEEFRV